MDDPIQSRDYDLGLPLDASCQQLQLKLKIPAAYVMHQ